MLKAPKALPDPQGVPEPLVWQGTVEAAVIVAPLDIVRVSALNDVNAIVFRDRDASCLKT